MINCIFTLDYEIYGNGQGSLRELVIEPTQKLAQVFQEFDAKFVVFVEAVEFPKIEEAHSDPDSTGVRAQLRDLRACDHEIALHLHPWWSKARFEDGRWLMDWSERSIGALEPDRVDAIVSAAIAYLRDAVGDPQFVPFSFRSGLWVMQPTPVIGRVLARHGVAVDSSLFKGGRVRGLGLDFRPAMSNGNSWRFCDDVNVPDPDGQLLEVPIHTEMVPFWEMLGGKRLKLQSKTRKASEGSPLPRDWRDFVRFRYPKKLDFCRMTFAEMRETITGILSERCDDKDHRSVVAIGHSKDFVDTEAVRNFLAFLRDQNVAVSTFAQSLRTELQPTL